MSQVNHDEEQLDYSQPLSILVRRSTINQHNAVSESLGAKLLLGGELSIDEYVRYLMMLWHIYSALEQALDQHASHPALESTYNPSLLARTSSLSADISHYLQLPEDAWKTHPIFVNLTTNMPPELSAYIARVQVLSSATTSNDLDGPTQLLSHAYIRYLGDLSGGQIARYAIAAAYDLKGPPETNVDAAADEEPSSQTFSYEPVPGITFYEFRSLRSNKPANQGEIKRIKVWFKEGMNSAGEKLGVVGKRAIVAELKKAYELNGALLGSLRGPSVSSIDDSEQLDSKPKSITSTVPVHIVIVLLAACLVHFIWSTSAAKLFRFVH